MPSFSPNWAEWLNPFQLEFPNKAMLPFKQRFCRQVKVTPSRWFCPCTVTVGFSDGFPLPSFFSREQQTQMLTVSLWTHKVANWQHGSVVTTGFNCSEDDPGSLRQSPSTHTNPQKAFQRTWRLNEINSGVASNRKKCPSHDMWWLQLR